MRMPKFSPTLTAMPMPTDLLLTRISSSSSASLGSSRIAPGARFMTSFTGILRVPITTISGTSSLKIELRSAGIKVYRHEWVVRFTKDGAESTEQPTDAHKYRRIGPQMNADEWDGSDHRQEWNEWNE